MTRRDLVGTPTLVRMRLRRDRVTLSIWVYALGLIPISLAKAYDTYYPHHADRARLTATVGRNPSVTVLYGKGFDLSTAGGFTAWRVGGFLAVFIGLMAVFTVTRHTRADEDTGRAELLASGGVGRFALLTSAVAVTAGACVAIGIFEAVVLMVAGLPAGGCWAFGLATAGMGVVATGIAAVACQVAEYSRTANGIGSAAVGAAFLLRAVGDSGSSVHWLTWLSPLGWVEQARPFAHERWWVFGLPAVVSVLLLGVAYVLAPRRDLGAGFLRPRPGPARAEPSLASPLALAWRLQRGALIGWGVAMVVAGGVFGSIADGIKDLVGSSAKTRQVFERLGGSTGLVNAFLALMVAAYAMIVALYGIQAVLRLRSEETSQRVEPILATRVSRLQWAATQLVFAFGGSALLLLVGAAATGCTHGLRTGHVGHAVLEMVGSALVQVPAAWLVVAIGVLLFGLLPRFSSYAWGVAGLAVGISLFGAAANLPHVVLDVSPFAHPPKLPGSPFRGEPLVILVGLAIAASGAGLAGLRRRDIG